MTKTLFQLKLDLILKCIQKELPTNYFEDYFSDLAITRMSPFRISFKSSKQDIIQKNFYEVFEYSVINSYRKAKELDSESNPILDGNFAESYEDCYRHYMVNHNLKIEWQDFKIEDIRYINSVKKQDVQSINTHQKTALDKSSAQAILEPKDITTQFLSVLENYIPHKLLLDLKNIRVWCNHKTIEIECLTPTTKQIVKSVMRSITSATFDLFEECLEVNIR